MEFGFGCKQHFLFWHCNSFARAGKALGHRHSQHPTSTHYTPTAQICTGTNTGSLMGLVMTQGILGSRYGCSLAWDLPVPGGTSLIVHTHVLRATAAHTCSPRTAGIGSRQHSHADITASKASVTGVCNPAQRDKTHLSSPTACILKTRSVNLSILAESSAMRTSTSEGASMSVSSSPIVDGPPLDNSLGTTSDAFL